jgi:transcriptional regulator with XRE-family HTH domain
MAGGYARRVGDRLRAIRKQKGLSLQEVEASSTQEFKASVLGAYERGERAISVPRLQRLARFYNVPVDQLLPRDVDIDLTEPGGDDDEVDMGARQRAFDNSDKITIDFNGRMLTIRRDDLRAIAAAAGLDIDALVRRLDDLQLRKF